MWPLSSWSKSYHNIVPSYLRKYISKHRLSFSVPESPGSPTCVSESMTTHPNRYVHSLFSPVNSHLQGKKVARVPKDPDPHTALMRYSGGFGESSFSEM